MPTHLDVGSNRPTSRVRPRYFTYDGIAFHGGEPVEPVPASHACVRLTDASIDELFPLLTKGTPVSVY